MGNCGDAERGQESGEEPYGCPPYTISTCWTPDICVWGGDPVFLSLSNPAQARSGGPYPLVGDSQMAGQALTIEELDDVGEVHVVVTDNLTVGLYQGQGNE